MGASNVEFHLQPSLAVVAKQTVVSSACEVGTSTGMFELHLLQNGNSVSLVNLTSSDLLMTRLVFKSMPSSKSQHGLTTL